MQEDFEDVSIPSHIDNWRPTPKLTDKLILLIRERLETFAAELSVPSAPESDEEQSDEEEEEQSDEESEETDEQGQFEYGGDPEILYQSELPKNQLGIFLFNSEPRLSFIKQQLPNFQYVLETSEEGTDLVASLDSLYKVTTEKSLLLKLPSFGRIKSFVPWGKHFFVVVDEKFNNALFVFDVNGVAVDFPIKNLSNGRIHCSKTQVMIVHDGALHTIGPDLAVKRKRIQHSTFEIVEDLYGCPDTDEITYVSTDYTNDGGGGWTYSEIRQLDRYSAGRLFKVYSSAEESELDRKAFLTRNHSGNFLTLLNLVGGTDYQLLYLVDHETLRVLGVIKHQFESDNQYSSSHIRLLAPTKHLFPFLTVYRNIVQLFCEFDNELFFLAQPRDIFREGVAVTFWRDSWLCTELVEDETRWNMGRFTITLRTFTVNLKPILRKLQL